MNLVEIALVGLVATAASDLWQQAQKPFTGIPAANWPLTGRWVLGWREGRLCDPVIGTRPPLRGEALVGWTFHYLIGLIYGAMYLAMVSILADARPTPLNALIFGLATLIAPFLLMKPALGGGLFGLKAANPARGLFLSISAHAVFGLGLFGGELIYRAIAN